MRRLVLIVMGFLVLSGATAGLRAQQASNGPSAQASLLAQNPKLAELSRLEPDSLAMVLARLGEISTGNRLPGSRTGSRPTLDEGAQIANNPAFAAASNRNADETLLLLRKVNEDIRKAQLRTATDKPGRIALVVGTTGDRSWGPLTTTKNDAVLIAKTLRQLGFTLVGDEPLIDPDQQHLRDAIKRFGQTIGPNTTSLFYYAGHGVQFNGDNYLVPFGASIPRTQDDYDRDLVDVDDTVLRQMQQAGGRLNIIVLDACRDHPSTFTVASRGGRPVQGLATPKRPPGMTGTVFIYSTAPNELALDHIHEGDANSPFAAAFSQAIVKPGIDMQDAYQEIQQEVSHETNGAQQPWITYAGAGKFYFDPNSNSDAAVSTLPKEDTPTQSYPRALHSHLELADFRCKTTLETVSKRVERAENITDTAIESIDDDDLSAFMSGSPDTKILAEEYTRAIQERQSYQNKYTTSSIQYNMNSSIINQLNNTFPQRVNMTNSYFISLQSKQPSLRSYIVQAGTILIKSMTHECDLVHKISVAEAR